MAVVHKKIASGPVYGSGGTNSEKEVVAPSSGTTAMVKTLIVFNGDTSQNTVKVFYGPAADGATSSNQMLEVVVDSKDTFEWTYPHMLPVEGGTDKLWIEAGGAVTVRYFILGAEES